jgi:hypothetical protein
VSSSPLAVVEISYGRVVVVEAGVVEIVVC